jgi:hypothetical protein
VADRREELDDLVKAVYDAETALITALEEHRPTSQACRTSWVLRWGKLESRGQVLRTDVDDAARRTSQTKVGPSADGAPGGCTNIRISIGASGPVVDSTLPLVSTTGNTAWPFAEISVLPTRQSRWMN